MKTNLHLLIIVLVAIFNLSSGFTNRSTGSNEKNIKTENKQYASTVTGENQKEKTGTDILPVPMAPDKTGVHKTHSDDDGVMHFFHFDRVRRARRCAGIYCSIMKLILVITHVSLLIWGFVHVLHS